MIDFLNRYATPFTTGLFLISLISGLALFFHFEVRFFHGMHEWLSIALILPFVFHIWKNWRPFVAYFKRPPMAIASAICLAAGLFFALPAITGMSVGETNPSIAMIELVLSGSTAEVSALLDREESHFIAQLKQEGFTAADSGRPLMQIAEASGKDPRELVNTLVAMKE